MQLQVGISALAMLSAASGALGSMATIDFEDFAPSTQFGSGFNSAGDLVFSRQGIDATVENYTQGGFSSLNALVINGGNTEPPFLTSAASFNNIDLRFDFTNLGFAVTQVTFEYVDQGGGENLGVNGSSIVEVFSLSSAPATIGGATVTVTEGPVLGGVGGVVTITGLITDITVGGQEFGIDNVVATPTPASAALLGLGGLAAVRRRR